MATFTSVHDAHDHTGVPGVGGGGAFSGARVYNSAVQSLANNTQVPLTFDSEDFDTDAYHSTASNTSRFTVPSGKAGKYSLSAAVQFASNSTGVRTLRFRLNGTDYLSGYVGLPAAPSSSMALTHTAIVALAEGDYVEAIAFQNSGGALNVGSATDSDQAAFSLVYLGA